MWERGRQTTTYHTRGAATSDDGDDDNETEGNVAAAATDSCSCCCCWRDDGNGAVGCNVTESTAAATAALIVCVNDGADDGSGGDDGNSADDGDTGGSFRFLAAGGSTELSKTSEPDIGGVQKAHERAHQHLTDPRTHTLKQPSAKQHRSTQRDGQC